MKRILRWMRRIPVVAWIALGLVVVFLLWRRTARVSRGLVEQNRALRRVRRAEQWRVATERRARDVHDVEVRVARAKHENAHRQLEIVREDLARAQGPALTEELNRYFTSPPDRP